MSATLSPADKVAVLLMALGEELAADIFRQMQPDEVRRVGGALSRLGRIDQATIDMVMDEFLSLLHMKGPKLPQDGVGFAARAIQLAFKGEAGERLAQQSARGETRMRALERADVPTLARILMQEQPQTIALVLAHAKPEQASALIRLWPETARTEILLRLARLQAVNPEVVAELDQQLITEIDRMGSAHALKRGGSKHVAAILNRLDKDGLRLLETLSERQPDLADEIRQKMFTFDDLVLLDDRGMQELIKTVPQASLLLALRGTNEQVKQLFFKNMSQRAAKLLAEDMTAMPAQKASDVSQAQNSILEKVRQLEEEGKIIIDRMPRAS